MEKYNYDENNGLWYELRGGYYIPLPDSTKRRGKAHRDMGTAAPAVHQDGTKSPVHGAFDQRQTEYLSGRYQRTGNSANAPADKADGRA